MFGGATSSWLPDTSSNELRDIVASLPLSGSILHVVFYVTFDMRHMKLLQGSERTEPKAAAKYDASSMACNEKDLISEKSVAMSHCRVLVPRVCQRPDKHILLLKHFLSELGL